MRPVCRRVPRGAISIRRFEVGDIRRRLVTLLATAEKPVERVELICSQDAQSREDLLERIVADNGTVVAKLPVSCAARVDEVDMMKPFELGATTVVVRQCQTCRYRGAMDRLAKRVGRTKAILDAAGVGGDHLILE